MAGQHSPRFLFPREKNHYVISTADVIAAGNTIHRAKYVNPATMEEVAIGIRIVNTYEIEDIYSFATELHEAEALHHQNLIKVHCSFSDQDRLWVIMSQPGVSVNSMIGSSSRLPENVAAFILKESLGALHYLHGKKKVHQNLNSGCVFLDDKFEVKLAYNSLVSFDIIPIADEIMTYYRLGNDRATDIWMFGLLALELFYGRIPVTDFEEFQLLIGGIEDEVREKRGNRDRGSKFLAKLGLLSCFRQQRKKIPKMLGEVVAACMARDPERRPATDQLMEYDLFQRRFTVRSLEKVMKKASIHI